MSLNVFFLNVGHGDCTVIEHLSGRLTMIDVNNSQDYDAESFDELVADELRKSNALYAISPTIMQDAIARDAASTRVKRDLTDPIEFMKRRFPERNLWRFVLTHPDMDHMRGIKNLYNEVGFDNFWDTDNQKSVTSFRSASDREDWEFYQMLRVAMTKRRYNRGDSLYAFGKEESGMPGGDGIEVLSPTPSISGSCNTSDHFNDISLVLRLNHAGRKILLPGDAESLAWSDMVNTYGDNLKSDFLKASHHGRDSGYHMEAVRHIKPIMTFLSVGLKPSTDASNKYKGFSERVASTRFYGNIQLHIEDSGNFQWLVDYNAGT